MEGTSRSGSGKSKLGRKGGKKRSAKKRPVSAVSACDSCGAFASDRYHSTSFPLVSDSFHHSGADDSSRMSWCSDGSDHAVSNSFDYLPFLLLPAVCQIKIFGFLSNMEKGRAARVCKDWAGAVQNPCLWDRVSFSELPQSCLPLISRNHAVNDQCYTCFKKRVFLFADWVEKIRPILRYLEFRFDISDPKTNYLHMIDHLLAKCACRDLRVAHLNWKETPSEPLWQEELDTTRCEEVVQKHRHRQRLFVQFFQRFTGLAPRLHTLALPFDWSDSSLNNLARLRQSLRNLVIEKYFVFQNLPQDSLDRFMLAVPGLRQLLLEVWTPSAHGLLMYTMTHKTLQYLDISQSRGFYLKGLNMPALRTFRVARHPWNGPLVLAEHLNIACLHAVLAIGCPHLTKINDHYLEADWHHSPSDRLEEVLRNVCSCKRHKTGWHM